MFPSLAARETYVAETNFAARKQKLFLPEVKNTFVSRTQLLLPQHLFLSLVKMQAMLVSFQCRSLIKSVFQQRRSYWPTAKKLKQVKLNKKNKRKGKMKKSKCWLRCMRKGFVSEDCMKRGSKVVVYSQFTDVRQIWYQPGGLVYHCTRA